MNKFALLPLLLLPLASCASGASSSYSYSSSVDKTRYESTNNRYFLSDFTLDDILSYFQRHGRKKNSLGQYGVSSSGYEEYDYYQILDGFQGEATSYDEFDFFPNTGRFVIGHYTKTRDSASYLNTVYTYENIGSSEIYYGKSVSTASFVGKHASVGMNVNTYQIVASAEGVYSYTFSQIGDGYILPEYKKVTVKKSETSSSIKSTVPEGIYNGLRSGWRFAEGCIEEINPKKTLTGTSAPKSSESSSSEK